MDQFLFIKSLTSAVLFKLQDPETDPNSNPNQDQEQKFRIRQKKARIRMRNTGYQKFLIGLLVFLL